VWTGNARIFATKTAPWFKWESVARKEAMLGRRPNSARNILSFTQSQASSDLREPFGRRSSDREFGVRSQERFQQSSLPPWVVAATERELGG
jgi:hypothetical protein